MLYFRHLRVPGAQPATATPMAGIAAVIRCASRRSFYRLWRRFCLGQKIPALPVPRQALAHARGSKASILVRDRDRGAANPGRSWLSSRPSGAEPAPPGGLMLFCPATTKARLSRDCRERVVHHSHQPDESLFRSRKYRDPVAAEGSYPELTADRDCHGARCEGLGIRLIDQLCCLQCLGIDPHHISRVLSLACRQNGAIRCKSDVVYAKTHGNRIALYRSLTAR
jgi:hypothetical protein